MAAIWHLEGRGSINHQCVAVSQRLPAFVDGTGEHTITDLIAQTNATRSVGRSGPLSKILVDEHAVAFLQSQTLGMGSVPACGQRVFIRPYASMDLGGVGINCDITLHPDTHQKLSKLTRDLGLQVASTAGAVQASATPAVVASM